MLECKIGYLGPKRGRLPWATQQMTNDIRSFALPITVKQSVSKGFCSTLRKNSNNNNRASPVFL